MRDYRMQVKMPREISERLHQLQQEVKDKSGKKVSRNALVVEILRAFFENSSGFSRIEEKTCISQEKS